MKRNLDLIERYAAWMFVIDAKDAPRALGDGSFVDLLCEAGKGEAGILMRLAGLVGTVPVTRLIVMSPYWDANLDGLLGLIDAMRPQEIIIALSAHRQIGRAHV